MPDAPAAAAPADDALVIEAVRFDLTRLRNDDFGLLDAVERARAGRFHYEIHRSRFIAAHAAVRRLLGERLRMPPAAVPITRTPLGKPVLGPAAAPTGDASTDAAPLHFNLSHCDDIGWLAIAVRPVGIDVERIRPLDDLLPLIQSHCTRNEIDRLITLPPADRAEAFLRIWTRKEAVLKAWGTGIGEIELSTLEVGLDGARVKPPVDLERAHPGRFAPLAIVTRRFDGEVLTAAAPAAGALRLDLGGGTAGGAAFSAAASG